MRSRSISEEHSIEAEPHAGVIAADRFLLHGCEVCRRLGEVRGDAAAKLLRADRVASSVEAVVDAFGFCARHGPSLLCADRQAGTLLTTLLAATAGIIDLLGNEARNADRLHDLFFNADAACPVCRFGEHDATHAVRATVGSAVSQPPREPLCFPHYREIAYAPGYSALAALARSQLTVLRRTAELVKTLVVEAHERDTGGDTSWNERLRAVLSAVAGEESDPAVHAPQALTEQRWRLHDTGACPICATMGDAHANWLAAVRVAARLADDAWIVFPNCPRHIWECAQLGDARLALRLADHATTIAVQIVECGIAMVDNDNEKRRIAAQSVWYRRQGASYILGRQRKMITKLARCVGCERSAVAREGAVTRLACSLRSASAGNMLERTRELCVKHFAAVYLLLPAGDLRAKFVSVQLERLQQLHRCLEAALAAPAARDSACRQGVAYEAVRCLSSWY